jgi:predicted RNase H-like HicB family nuclease
MKNYVALVEFDSETGKYGVIVPDLPGFSSVGDTFEAAIKNATEGMASHIAVMKELGERIPAPSSIEAIKKNWDGWDDWNNDVQDYMFAMIPILPPYGTQRILVSIDTGLVARIDRVARNRSAFLASAAQRLLDEDPLRLQA